MMEDSKWKGNFGEGSKSILPGVHGINQRNARPASTGSMKKFTRFDPINSTLIHSLTPQLPPVYESINPARRIDFRQRDVQSIEHLHRQELLKNSKAFHRRRGENQAYVESALRQSDMLVWQGCQARDETKSILNQMKTRPKSEVYDIDTYNLANTARNASSPFLSHRHNTAQLRRLQLNVDSQRRNSGLMSSMTPSRKALPDGVGSSNLDHSHRFPNDRMQMMGTHNKFEETQKLKRQEETHNKLLEFERKQHQKMNFSDWTKQELIELIEAEGLEVPGEMLWDNDAGEMRKEVCRKQVYVDHCKRKLFEAEPKPLVRSGKKLRIRDNYCIVDVFKAAHGAVRVQAYDDKDSREYQLLLISNKMHELDLDSPPQSTDKKEWHAWSKLLIPRLELTDDGMLQVGDPPLQENGLPAHFTLGASSSLSIKRAATTGGVARGGDQPLPEPYGVNRGSFSKANQTNIVLSAAAQLELNDNQSRQSTARSSFDDRSNAHTNQSKTNPGGKGGRKGSRGGNLTALRDGGRNQDATSNVIRSELPPADRMHVTLFFRSL